MATFLEICNQVNDIIGLQGSISSVTSPIGLQRNIVNAVRSSWIDIQNLREDWTFLDGSITNFVTIIDQIEYTPQEVLGITDYTDLKSYKIRKCVFYQYLPLTYYRYEDLPFIDNTNAREPSWYSFNPLNNNLIIEKPDDTYTLDIRYNRNVQTLTNPSDVPIIPASFHNLIVYRAVQHVAAYIGNSPMRQEFAERADYLTGSLQRQFIPERRVYPGRFL